MRSLSATHGIKKSAPLKFTKNRYFAIEHRDVRRYVQDERYFAIEHMDVRCEASQSGTTLKKACPPNSQRTVLRNRAHGQGESAKRSRGQPGLCAARLFQFCTLFSQSRRDAAPTETPLPHGNRETRLRQVGFEPVKNSTPQTP